MTAALVLALAVAGSDGPLVYEVPRHGVSLEAQRRPAFSAAPFTVTRGRLVRGEWVPSDRLLGKGLTRVVVLASWCPTCHQLLASASRSPPRRTVFLFREDEAERAAGGGAGLSDSASLERYALPFHLLRSSSDLARAVTRYPMSFLCSRWQCRPEPQRRRAGAPSTWRPASRRSG